MGPLMNHSSDELAVGTPAPPSAGFSFSAVWMAVRHNSWLLASVTVAAGLIAAYYSTTLTRLYMATATIRFEPVATQPLEGRVADSGNRSNEWNREEFYNTEQFILRSKAIALPVVRRLGLTSDEGFAFGTKSTKRTLKPLMTESEAAAALVAGLSVKPVRDSRIAIVSYSDANPERAARVLGAVLESYIEQRRADSARTSTDASEWLQNREAELQRELARSEAQIDDYRRDKQMLSVSADDQAEMLRARMAQLTADVTRVESERARVGSRRGELRKIDGVDPSNLPATELAESQVLVRLRERYVQAAEELEALVGSGRGAKHPEVAATQSRRDAARTLLLAEVANIKASVEHDYDALSKQIASLQALIGAAEREALRVNQLAIEFKRLERARDTNEKLYSVVNERSKELDVTRQMRPAMAHVVDEPEVPRVPYTPQPRRIVGLGVLFGFALGIALALLREQLDATLKAPDHAEELVGRPILGLLPQLQQLGSSRTTLDALRKSSISKRPSRRSLLGGKPEIPPSVELAEAMRGVRTNLMLGAGTRGHQVVLLTSAVPGEGKTTVTAALASSLAGTGKKVVVVDGDLRRPRLHRLFALPNAVGVGEVLTGAVTLDEALADSGEPGLAVMRAGHVTSSSSEAFHRPEFTALIRELRSRFDYVLIDSPPLTAVTDGAILGTHADSVVFVVRANYSKKPLIRRATRVLYDVGATVVGVVVNGVDFTKSQYRYHYYGYGDTRTASSIPPAA